MGVPETDLIEEMDLSSVECLNMVRPPARCHRLARVPPTQDERTAGEIYPPPDPPLASDPRRSHPTHISPSARIRIRLTRRSHRAHIPRPPPSHDLQATGKEWSNAVKPGYREDAGLLCQSDDDEQLIVTIPFRQLVNLTSLIIRGPADGTAPKKVKVFVNKPNLSFDNCGKKATETVSLTAEQATGEDKIELDFTQFQNVRVISIFVDDNQGGGDVTNVSKIIVNGHPVHTTNMSELKKC